ncbi:MAG: Smr/MutS family protein [Gammaproteobacteria bacterium]|nr:Smr/MutS family protein [Gammaproteobacteria bacterium]MBY0544955.1 Smr/MutS family protein [Gammaproteobacteria bacterium]
MTKKFGLSDEDKRLFAEAMAATQPLSSKKQIKESKKLEDKQNLAYRRYQASKTSPAAELAPLVSAETPLLFQRATISDKKFSALQQGLFPNPPILDLHGLKEDEAMTKLKDFIYESHQKKIKVVLIVHGKGNRNTLNAPILKNAVNMQLRHLEIVLAFCSARSEEGGTGAIYVLLK